MIVLPFYIYRISNCFVFKVFNVVYFMILVFKYSLDINISQYFHTTENTPKKLIKELLIECSPGREGYQYFHNTINNNTYNINNYTITQHTQRQNGISSNSGGTIRLVQDISGKCYARGYEGTIFIIQL